MFYRRKIILALLEKFDGELNKIRFQKLLFLLTQRQSKADYDFIPYRFGCYSYSANADMAAMVRKRLILENKESFSKNDNINYFNQLKPEDKAILINIKDHFGNLSANALMKFTYIHYPFYATKSEVAENILNKEEYKKVKNSIAKSSDTVLFTIGYEGISLEKYLVRLLQYDIKVLVDVRNNPVSMKYGFSKNQLKKYCESIGVTYEHYPEVGIQSNKRQQLKSQSDYDHLFEKYRKYDLPKTTETQYQIVNLLKIHNRIALTCFEANICQCHRKHLSEAIQKLPSFSYELKHI